MKADTTVKWFSSDLEGAPELRGQVGEMIALLSACLVDGFGARTPDTLVVSDGVAIAHFAAEAPYRKHSVVRISGASEPLLDAEWRLSYQQGGEVRFDCPGVPDGGVVGAGFAFASAGWARPFSAPALHKAVFQSQNLAGTQCCLRIDDSDLQYAQVRGYEVMTSVDAGVRPFPTSSTAPGWMKSATEGGVLRKWLLAADDRCVVLLVDFKAIADTYGGYSAYAFGDLADHAQADGYACILSAHQGGVASNPSQGLSFYLGSFAGTAEGGLSIARNLAGTTYSPWGTASSVPGGFVQYGGDLLRYFPIRVVDGAPSRYRGRVPGLYAGEAYNPPLRDQQTDLPGGALLEFAAGASSFGQYAKQGALKITGPWR